MTDAPSPSAFANTRWLVVGWLVVVSLGMGLVVQHSLAAGEPADAPLDWPRESTLELDAERPTLVLSVHPQCACTRATLAELARLMTRLSGAARVYVVMNLPEGVGDDWEQTDLWRSAARIEGATLIADRGGRETRRFGARTSGQVLLYGPDRALWFAGGITPTRAHEGDSIGRRRIVALVTGAAADRATSVVYGCSHEDEAGADFWLPSFRGANGMP
jgi:hypothetical protein